MKPADAGDYAVGVVGAGAMGQGIAQVSAAGGMRTLLLDSRPGAAEAAREAIAGRFARLAEKGRMTADEAAAASALVEVATSAADLALCDAVVEAIVEDLDAKRAVFAEIEAAVSPACLIASNTSSIPIASLARGMQHRGRIAGLHFFNPVPLMRLVEVIRAAETSPEAVEALAALGKRMGRTPVVVKDSPGFLVNLGGRAFTTEALRIVHEQIATPSQIDAIMREGWGFRMGPFELMDLTGIDVNYPVSQIVHDGYMLDPRIRTSPNHRAMFEAGMLGRKTGQGWYRYEGGAVVDVPSPDHAPDCAPAKRVAILDAENPALVGFCDTLGIEVVADDGTALLLAAPTGPDATMTALDAGADAARLVCVDLASDTTARVTLMTAPGADPACLDAVAAAVIASGRKVTAIKDSPGFVGPRIAAMIANLGCYMAEIGLASPEDIDLAMKLGLNYPAGPLELAERIGARETLDILSSLQDVTGDDRYRPTPWLRRRALLGLPVATPA